MTDTSSAPTGIEAPSIRLNGSSSVFRARFGLIGVWLCLGSAFVMFGASGCSDLLKQPTSAKALFSIEPGVPDLPLTAIPMATHAAEPVLQVRLLRVSAPFDSIAFVYQTGPSQYALDYYNNFVASPSVLLSQALLAWLEKAGPLPTVGAGTSVRPDMTLECDITKLLIDFTDPANPRAVIAARFLLYDNRTATTRVLVDSSNDVSKPLALNTPAGYAAGWGMAFREMLQMLEIDLCHSLSSSDK